MAKTSTTDEQAPVKPERFIYCGPSLPGGLLQQYTIYKGGIPVHLSDAIEKCPAIKALFVAPAKLQAVTAAIQSAGTLENLRYKEIQKFLQEGGLKRDI
ncbi:hypothetical protein [Sporomusa acidovorans]|uniref:Uncharacterized protein n=1 Tax=Sporomusa acidovorans (strain ATCC 49682 / DSM 3132 / Mol) TaxID=1123286 RepID=A0ABZ3J9D3_SPOA4|nr:hypothetical protein [Sporomusa acidovorans]OZC16014.1 hypothetical protein SPACI_43800 [Sporomusa acidovorans DSM 3132]SDD89670.1 hypothetical protein SAMN04488499_1005117 [Sporomusa acidovorans]